MMLTGVEEAFRCLKSELGLRPVYHQKDIQAGRTPVYQCPPGISSAGLYSEGDLREGIDKSLGDHPQPDGTISICWRQHSRGDHTGERVIRRMNWWTLRTLSASRSIRAFNAVSPHPLGIQRVERKVDHEVGGKGYFEAVFKF